MSILFNIINAQNHKNALFPPKYPRICQNVQPWSRRSNETGQSWRRIMELGFGHYTLYRPTQSFLHKLCLNLSYSSQLNHSFLSKLYLNVSYSSYSSLLITNLSQNYISLSHILHILHY